MARMCEPRLGILIQGRMRNLGLSMTRGRFFSRSCGVHPMNLSRGASLHATVAEAEAWRRASRCGRGRRSASGRRPGSCSRDSGSGRRTRSTACPRGSRVRRAAGRAGRISSRSRDVGGREQRRLGVRSEGDRTGSALPLLRWWQPASAPLPMRYGGKSSGSCRAIARSPSWCAAARSASTSDP